MSEQHDDELELDAELEQLSAEALRVETIDPETGKRRFEGYVTRSDVARAMLGRDTP